MRILSLSVATVALALTACVAPGTRPPDPAQTLAEREDDIRRDDESRTAEERGADTPVQEATRTLRERDLPSAPRIPQAELPRLR